MDVNVITQRLAVLRSALVQAGWVRLVATLGVLAFAVVVARLGWELPVTLGIERALYDVRVAVTAPRVEQDKRIVLVTFTEDTIQATGKRSPLDRVLLGKALVNIDKLKPRSIGVDILVDSPQPEDPMLMADLATLSTPTFFAFSTITDNGRQVMTYQEQHMRDLFARLARGPVKPASIRLDVDDDDVWRVWPTPAKLPPPLLINALTAAAGKSMGYENFSGAAVFRRPVDKERPVFLSLPVDLFADPATAAAFADQIAGRIVLIGADLPEADRFVTPVTRVTGETTPGVELHATLVAQALDGVKLAPIPGLYLWLAAGIVVLLAAITGGFDLPIRIVVPLGLVQVVGITAAPFLLENTHLIDT